MARRSGRRSIIAGRSGRRSAGSTGEDGAPSIGLAEELRLRPGVEFGNLRTNFRFVDSMAEVGGEASGKIAPVDLVDVGTDQVHRVFLRLLALLAEEFGSPEAGHLVPPRHGAEHHLLIMCKLVFEGALAFVELRHRVSSRRNASSQG